MSTYTPTRQNYYENNRDEIREKRKQRYQANIIQEREEALERHNKNKKRNNATSLKYSYKYYEKNQEDIRKKRIKRYNDNIIEEREKSLKRYYKNKLNKNIILEYN